MDICFRFSSFSRSICPFFKRSIAFEWVLQFILDLKEIYTFDICFGGLAQSIITENGFATYRFFLWLWMKKEAPNLWVSFSDPFWYHCLEIYSDADYWTFYVGCYNKVKSIKTFSKIDTKWDDKWMKEEERAAVYTCRSLWRPVSL